MAEILTNNIQQLLKEFDSNKPQNVLIQIQSQIEEILEELENEDSQIFGFYKYIFAEKLLAKPEFEEDKKKKKYLNHLITYKESYLKQLAQINQKSENKDNKQNQSGIEADKNLLKETIIKFIKELEKIEDQITEHLLESIQKVSKIYITSSVTLFQSNNQFFKSILQYLKELQIQMKTIEEQLQQNNMNKTHEKDSEDKEYENIEEAQIKKDLERVQKINKEFQNYFDLLNFQFFEKISEDNNFKDNYYGNPILDLIAFGQKHKTILKIISPDKYHQYFKGDKFKNQVLILMRNMVNKHQEWKEMAMKEKEIREKAKDIHKIIEMYENDGKRFFTQANNAIKEQQRQMNQDIMIKKEIYKVLDISYEYYRVAMKYSDQNKLFEKSIICRNNLALCFYLKEDYPLAYIYTIGSLLLIDGNQSNPCIQKLKLETLKIQEKINSKKQRETSQEFQNNSAQLVNINQTSINTLCVSNQHKENRLQIKKDLNDLKLEPFNYILNIRYEKSGEYDITKYIKFENNQMTKAQNAATKTKILTTTITSALIVGTDLTSIIISTFCGIGIGSIGFFTLFLTPIVLFRGIKSVIEIKQQYSEYKDLHKIKFKLNEIIQRAIQLHKNQQYNEFLNELSEEYNFQNQQVRLIQITENKLGLQVKYDNFIPTLLQFGFRPDAVAYLLVLVGEAVFYSKQFQKHYEQQKSIASTIFQDIAQNEVLQNQAKEIDLIISQQIQNISNKQFKIFSEGQKLGELWKGNLLENSKYQIAYSDIERNAYESYEQKLNEIQDVACINLCLIQILNSQFDLAKITAKVIIEQGKQQYHYYYQTQEKIYALMDLLEILFSDSETEQLQLEETLFLESGSQHCQMVEQLKQLVQQNQLREAEKYISEKTEAKEIKNCENMKQFYYWCTICYDKLNNSKAGLFYIQKYSTQIGRDLEQEMQIRNIQHKFTKSIDETQN